MNIYKVERLTEPYYDDYDVIVVIAKSDKDAKTIQPGSTGWETTEHLKATKIGVADKGQKRGVVVAHCLYG